MIKTIKNKALTYTALMSILTTLGVIPQTALATDATQDRLRQDTATIRMIPSSKYTLQIIAYRYKNNLTNFIRSHDSIKGIYYYINYYHLVALFSSSA